MTTQFLLFCLTFGTMLVNIYYYLVFFLQKLNILFLDMDPHFNVLLGDDNNIEKCGDKDGRDWVRIITIVIPSVVGGIILIALIIVAVVKYVQFIVLYFIFHLLLVFC